VKTDGTQADRRQENSLGERRGISERCPLYPKGGH
jgi:hypothetical protein